MRENKYTAIILKKQPFGEADEIITFFTESSGKIRALAKSVKSSKSKLQQNLQALFLVNLTLSQGKLPKIISVEVVKTFSGLRENLEALKKAFYAVELVLKFTADEQKNQPLFLLIVDFFNFINDVHEEVVLDLSLAKFKISILEAAGLGVHAENVKPDSPKLFFSPSRGGFITEAVGADALSVHGGVYGLFKDLKYADMNQLKITQGSDSAKILQNLLSDFIEYQLERRIKSEKYLRSEI